MESTVDYGAISPAMIEAVEDASRAVSQARDALATVDLAAWERKFTAHTDAVWAWHAVEMAAPIGSLLRAAAHEAALGHATWSVVDQFVMDSVRAQAPGIDV